LVWAGDDLVKNGFVVLDRRVNRAVGLAHTRDHPDQPQKQGGAYFIHAGMALMEQEDNQLTLPDESSWSKNLFL